MSASNADDNSNDLNIDTKNLRLDSPIASRARSESPRKAPPAKKAKIEISSPLVGKKIKAEDKLTKAASDVDVSNKKTASQTSLSDYLTSKDKATKSEKSEVNMKLIDAIAKKRVTLYKSVIDFAFNKKRVRLLTNVEDIPANTNGVLYWMTRDQRVQDNWSLLYAQRLAIKQNLSLYVCFNLVPKFLDATIRHYSFMIEGLKEVEQELHGLKIPFFLMLGHAKDNIPSFVQKNNIGALVIDFSPLRIANTWIDDLKKKLPSNVPIVQVDAHNIVPCWHASDKLEYAARTIRNKINSKLDEFLTEYPPVIEHPNAPKLPIKSNDWEACYNSLDVNMDVGPIEWAKPGYKSGIDNLELFINKKLRFFDSDRNNPTLNALSNMSPWYHYGQVSVQRCIMELKPYKSKFSKQVEAYMEEAIVRRELADNFCFYQKNYDNLNGAYEWAQKTLNDHASDKRQFVYSKEQFEKAQTHDKLWNAAQIQVVKEGKMHGILTLYNI